MLQPECQQKYIREIYEQNHSSFDLLLQLYIDFNSKVNISAIRDEQGIIEKHFFDSLNIYTWIENQINSSNKLTKILDIGTGGGFPAIPLAITFNNYYPNLTEIIGLDSVTKKLRLIDLVVDKLQLSNLRSIAARAEDLAHNDIYRETQDIVLSRAVAYAPVILELMAGFAKVGAYVILFKQTNFEEERIAKKVAHSLGLEFFEKYSYVEKELWVFKKTKKLIKLYPRNYGKIKKSPLT